MRGVFIILISLILACQVNSQNLALSAVASASASSSGSYGPSNWNDGFIGPMFYFGWVGTDINFPQPAWIEYEWTSPQTFNTIVFHPPTWSNPGYVYFYGSAEVHYWDGFAWVNHHVFVSSTPTLVDTVSFQQITTSKVRVTNFTIMGQHNPGWDEIEVFNMQVASTYPDVGVCVFAAPADSVVANTALSVEVMICNTGTEIVYGIPVTYMPIGGLSATTDTIIIPSGLNPFDTIYHIFSVPLMVPAGITELCVFTHLPGDTVTANDTICKLIYATSTPPIGIEMNPFEAGNIRIFPQPAKDQLIIQKTDANSVINFRMVDIRGSILFSGSLRNNDEHRLDLGSVVPGIYLLYLVDGKSGFAKKVQVVR